MAELVTNLVEVQAELNAPKNQRNTFGNYNYRSAEDIIEAVKPLLKKRGLLLNISDEMVEVGGRVYVKAVAEVFDKENSMQATAYAREQETKKGMDDAQITGSASSYARKYALNGLFAIDDTKDPDTQDNTNEGALEKTAQQFKDKPKASPNKPASPKQKKLINDLFLQSGGEDGLQKDFIVKEGFDPEALTSADASSLIERLQENA